MISARAAPGPLHQGIDACAACDQRGFSSLLALYGELSTLARRERRPLPLPAYQHDALEACFAPLLHEIGLVIAHEGSHRHGEYMLRNAELFGFSQTDQRLLAALVRLLSRFSSSRALPFHTRSCSDTRRCDTSLCWLAKATLAVSIFMVLPKSAPCAPA